jgi:hypothetical protein
MIAGRLGIRITRWAVLSVILQAIQILIPLATDFASVGLFLLHAHSSGVRDRGNRVNDREGSIRIFLELLILVAVLERKLATGRTTGAEAEGAGYILVYDISAHSGSYKPSRTRSPGT